MVATAAMPKTGKPESRIGTAAASQFDLFLIDSRWYL
jgi:hypothetical protein